MMVYLDFKLHTWIKHQIKYCYFLGPAFLHNFRRMDKYTLYLILVKIYITAIKVVTPFSLVD